MNKLHNNTNSDIKLPTGEVIPAGDSIECEDVVINRLDNVPYLNSQLVNGRLVLNPKDVTRREIKDANRETLIDILTAHGLNPDDLEELPTDSKSKSKQTLRNLAFNTVFTRCTELGEQVKEATGDEV